MGDPDDRLRASVLVDAVTDPCCSSYIINTDGVQATRDHASAMHASCCRRWVSHHTTRRIDASRMNAVNAPRPTGAQQKRLTSATVQRLFFFFAFDPSSDGAFVDLVTRDNCGEPLGVGGFLGAAALQGRRGAIESGCLNGDEGSGEVCRWVSRETEREGFVRFYGGHTSRVLRAVEPGEEGCLHVAECVSRLPMVLSWLACARSLRRHLVTTKAS